MQPNKYKNKISDTSQYFKDSSTFLSIFSTMLKEFNLTKINSVLSTSKKKGVDCKNIFQILFVLPFVSIDNIKTLMGLGISKELHHRKDVYYDFMNNERINWRAILCSFSSQFIQIVKKNSKDKNCKIPKCLIVDDSLLPKSGNKIELIGKVYDHCCHTYKLGMKLLTLGYWDGKSFIPVDFSIHNEPGKNKIRGLKKKHIDAQFSKVRDINSAGNKRIEEVVIDKIEMAINMIKAAIKNKFPVDYILADSWFITEKFIKEIQLIKLKNGIKINIIGLMKSNRILVVNKIKVKASSIPELKRKDIKYCNKFKCYYIPLTAEYKEIRLKVFWVKMKGQNSWKTLVTTDEKLSFINAMKNYQIRWSIEVFFKDCKQNLGLNNCQSTDFDAYIASISICFMNYIVLSLRKRFDDYETIGGLFQQLKDDFLEATIIEKIWTFLIDFYNSILSELGVDIDLFISKIIENETFINEKIKENFEILFSCKRSAA